MNRPFRILVVEDEFLIATELDNTLRKAGYQVVGPVPNVSAALQMLKRERPDAAVLDLNLEGQLVTPVVEVLRALRVPFVLSSAYNLGEAEPLVRNAINVGKPTRSDQLLREIGTLIRSSVPQPS